MVTRRTILSNLEDITTNTLLNKRRESRADLCGHCEGSFKEGEDKVLFNLIQFHKKCFVCAQCLNELEIDVVFENDGRMYCLHDYKMLFALSCFQCSEFILEGRAIKALGHNWHAACFNCSSCSTSLSDSNTFKKIENNPYCQSCCARIRNNNVGIYMCRQCKGRIEANGFLKYQGDFYHPYHFKCQTCQAELDKNFREKNGEHFCLRCYDKMGIPICCACKRPIEERVIYALGKVYHVEHFTCSFCNKPFLGTCYFVHKNNVYCEIHYNMVAMKFCTYCNCDVASNSLEFFQKLYCLDHFRCFACDQNLNKNFAIYEMDGKPLCNFCRKFFPNHLKKRMKGLNITVK